MLVAFTQALQKPLDVFLIQSSTAPVPPPHFAHQMDYFGKVPILKEFFVADRFRYLRWVLLLNVTRGAQEILFIPANSWIILFQVFQMEETRSIILKISLIKPIHGDCFLPVRILHFTALTLGGKGKGREKKRSNGLQCYVPILLVSGLNFRKIPKLCDEKHQVRFAPVTFQLGFSKF